MGVLVEKIKMMVKSTNPRKEGKGEGMTLASDLKVEFHAKRSFMEKLSRQKEGRFSDNFYNEAGDVRNEFFAPVVFDRKTTNLKVTIWARARPMVFEGATLKDGVSMKPEGGGYLLVSASIQVHPTAGESGKLDMLVKEMVEIQIETMTDDIEDGLDDDAGSEAGDS